MYYVYNECNFEKTMYIYCIKYNEFHDHVLINMYLCTEKSTRLQQIYKKIVFSAPFQHVFNCIIFYINT